MRTVIDSKESRKIPPSRPRALVSGLAPDEQAAVLHSLVERPVEVGAD
jgi:hypothetical protein